jgi:hypothetical protein
MAGWQINPFVLPDFGGSMIEGRQAQQAQQMNALALTMKQRDLQQSQAYENALMNPAVLSGLTSADPAARQEAYSILAQRGGIQGFQAAMPLIKQEREEAIVREALGGLGMADGMPMQAPQGAPVQQAGPMPAPGPGGDVRDRNAYFARLRDEILNRADMPPEQQQAALARVSAAQAGASGLPQAPGGYRSPEGVDGAYRGLPAPSGVVPAAMPTQQRQGAPSMQQVSALLASGNPRLVEIGKAWLPVVTRDPNYQTVQQGGNTYLFDPRTGARMNLGPTDDVREETRTIDGAQVQGQTKNGQFTPYPDRLPQGYRMNGGRLERIPGYQATEDTQRDFSNTRQLREEFNGTQVAKDFALLRTNIQAIRRAEKVDTRAADIDMVFAFAKMLDPNSVVREGEQLQLMRTGGIFDTVQGWISGLAGKARLTPEVRAAIAQQAEGRFADGADAHDERLSYFRELAQQNGLNPNQIGRLANARATQAAAPPPAQAAAPPALLSAASSALATARRELGAGASDDAVVARAREIMGR